MGGGRFSGEKALLDDWGWFRQDSRGTKVGKKRAKVQVEGKSTKPATRQSVPYYVPKLEAKRERTC